MWDGAARAAAKWWHSDRRSVVASVKWVQLIKSLARCELWFSQQHWNPLGKQHNKNLQPLVHLPVKDPEQIKRTASSLPHKHWAGPCSYFNLCLSIQHILWPIWYTCFPPTPPGSPQSHHQQPHGDDRILWSRSLTREICDRLHVSCPAWSWCHPRASQSPHLPGTWCNGGPSPGPQHERLGIQSLAEYAVALSVLGLRGLTGDSIHRMPAPSQPSSSTSQSHAESLGCLAVSTWTRMALSSYSFERFWEDILSVSWPLDLHEIRQACESLPCHPPTAPLPDLSYISVECAVKLLNPANCLRSSFATSEICWTAEGPPIKKQQHTECTSFLRKSPP